MKGKEVADPRVAEMFYREVTQALLLFCADTWTLSEEMERKVEGTHTRYLKDITGIGRSRRQTGHG